MNYTCLSSLGTSSKLTNKEKIKLLYSEFDSTKYPKKELKSSFGLPISDEKLKLNNLL